MSLSVTVIPGDGVGPEVIGAAIEAVDASGAEVEWLPAVAGAAALATHGVPLPQETLESIRRTRLALRGPIATPSGAGQRSVGVALRKELELFANLRPVRSIAGASARAGVDLVVVRENTQGMYSGVEHFVDEERSAAESISIITRKGSERLVEWAFQWALAHGRRRITLVHKANLLRCTSGLFLEAGRAVAARHPELEFGDLIVDSCALQLALDPTRFDVLVTTNLFGDILSDLAAGLVGGLGLAAGASVGRAAAVFEVLHDHGPEADRPDGASPVSAMLAAALLLDHAGERAAGARLSEAVRGAIASRQALPPELGGAATTRAFTRSVIERLR